MLLVLALNRYKAEWNTSSYIFQPNVQHGIVESPAHQEFQGEIYTRINPGSSIPNYCDIQYTRFWSANVCRC